MAQAMGNRPPAKIDNHVNVMLEKHYGETGWQLMPPSGKPVKITYRDPSEFTKAWAPATERAADKS